LPAHDDVAAGLVTLGGSAVQVVGETLTSYFPPPDDAARFGREAFVRLQALAGATPLHVDWRWEQDQDWSIEWRRGLRPRRVGPFVVTPSWCKPEPLPGDHVITLDPEMAFGTGEHATTRGALRLLAEAVAPGDHVLDVGSGSGILAIAAAMLGAGHVLAAEADGDALENAGDNLRRNGVAGRVELVHALVDPDFLRRAGDGAFQVIVANVLSGVLRPLLTSFHSALAPGGRLILGGILQDEAGSMLAAASAARFALRTEDVEDEWWGALLTR